MCNLKREKIKTQLNDIANGKNQLLDVDFSFQSNISTDYWLTNINSNLALTASVKKLGVTISVNTDINGTNLFEINSASLSWRLPTFYSEHTYRIGEKSYEEELLYSSIITDINKIDLYKRYLNISSGSFNSFSDMFNSTLELYDLNSTIIRLAKSIVKFKILKGAFNDV